jgi:hypothetical protein
MSPILLLLEYTVIHALVEKVFREPRRDTNREDIELIPIYGSIDKYRPLSMERLYIIDQMIEKGD